MMSRSAEKIPKDADVMLECAESTHRRQRTAVAHVAGLFSRALPLESIMQTAACVACPRLSNSIPKHSGTQRRPEPLVDRILSLI